jgi:hypothetical protein
MNRKNAYRILGLESIPSTPHPYVTLANGTTRELRDKPKNHLNNTSIGFTK